MRGNQLKINEIISSLKKKKKTIPLYYLKPAANKGRKKNGIVLYVSDKYGE